MSLRPTSGILRLVAVASILNACSGTPKPSGDNAGTDTSDSGPAVDTAPTDEDGDGYLGSDDCDETNPDVNDGAVEVCNGIDDDCNGYTDADDTYIDRSTMGEFYIDQDGDGYGIDESIVIACEPPEGYALYPDDCDETNPEINPGAEEVCDDLDNDCNGAVDDSSTEGGWYYPDNDGDGLGALGELVLSCSGSEVPLDCDDDDATEPQVVSVDAEGLATGTLGFPWATIQEGIDNADKCVLVLKGTYLEAIDFSGKSLSVVGAEGAATTIIDASGLGVPAVTIANGETSDASLSGFTVQGGDGNLSETSTSYSCGSLATCVDYVSSYCGGGIYISNASPTLSQLIVQDNQLPDASTTTSGDNTYYVYSFGGGLCLENATVTLDGVDLLNNAADSGGGAWLDEDAYVDWSNSWLVENNATDGAALSVEGGALTLQNVASVWNWATGEGGGLWAENSQVSATFVTWGEDDAASGGTITTSGAGSLTVMNSILYGANTVAGIAVTGSTTLSVSYSNLYDNAGGTVTGAAETTGSNGNISADPLFVRITVNGDPSDDNWHLNTGSPSENTGNPDSTYNDADGSTADQGAFGGAGAAWD